MGGAARDGEAVLRLTPRVLATALPTGALRSAPDNSAIGNHVEIVVIASYCGRTSRERPPAYPCVTYISA